jgi:hypothetical protein
LVASSAALEFVLGLPVMTEVEDQAGICRHVYQQWRAKSTNCGHAKSLGTWSMNPSYRWGLPGYMYCKTFMVNKCTGAGVYRWGSRRGHSFILGLYTTIFQADIYAIKACVMENTEKGYTGRNICILADSQAAIKALDSSR